MSGLLFLQTEDFNVQKGMKGNILCNGIEGFSLILFYSNHCKFCQSLIPIFRKLPGTIMGCQIGIVNIGTHKQIVRIAKETITPIEYVPYIILYINGKPYISYNGASPSEADIRKFVIDVANNVQKKQQFSKDVVKESPIDGGIPAYAFGKPLYGTGKDMVCYLDFSTAYKPIAPQQ